MLVYIQEKCYKILSEEDTEYIFKQSSLEGTYVVLHHAPDQSLCQVGVIFEVLVLESGKWTDTSPQIEMLDRYRNQRALSRVDYGNGGHFAILNCTIFTYESNTIYQHII